MQDMVWLCCKTNMNVTIGIHYRRKYWAVEVLAVSARDRLCVCSFVGLVHCCKASFQNRLSKLGMCLYLWMGLGRRMEKSNWGRYSYIYIYISICIYIINIIYHTHIIYSSCTYMYTKEKDN